MQKIFSVFESRKGSRGTGLGLPVSQKILREHGGDIRVESTPDVGSKFSLEFPPWPSKEEGESAEGAVLETLAVPLPLASRSSTRDDVTESFPGFRDLP